MGDLELSERWHGLDDASVTTQHRRQAVLHELELEIAPAHDLADVVVSVEAFFEASDDVIVRLVDGSYALVHPSWIGRAERPPHPTSERLGHGLEAYWYRRLRRRHGSRGHPARPASGHAITIEAVLPSGRGIGSRRALG